MEWPEILAECERLLCQSPMGECGSGGEGVRERPRRPEAAFRLTLEANSESKTRLDSIVGGIPKVVTSEVRLVATRLSVGCVPPHSDEQPIGVVTRRPPREDLYVFYRDCDASLVLYTLPEKFESKVILVALQGDEVVRQATLGGDVCRIEFSTLKPGSYLVASFLTVDLDALQQEALQLRWQGKYSEGLALLEESLQLDPEDAVAWARKAYMLRVMGRPTQARAAVEEALKINSECAFAWRAKGALLRDDLEHQQGLNCYLKSLELDPTDFLCWENKGNALKALGRDKEAREAYAKAAEVKKLYPKERH